MPRWGTLFTMNLKRKTTCRSRASLLASIESGRRERELIEAISAEVSAGRDSSRLERALLAELAQHLRAVA